MNGFKKLLAIPVDSDINYEEANMTKEYLKDTSKIASSAAPKASSTAAPEAKKEEAKPAEESEESDDDMGFGPFD